CFFFFQAEDGIRDYKVTGVQTCALPILEDGMGADQRVDLAQGQPCKDVVALASSLATGKDGDIYVSRSSERRNGVEMLPRQNFRRSHKRCLPASFNDSRRGE